MRKEVRSPWSVVSIVSIKRRRQATDHGPRATDQFAKSGTRAAICGNNSFAERRIQMFNRMRRNGALRLVTTLVLVQTLVIAHSASMAAVAAGRGRVVGTVTEPAGAKVAGAAVTLRDATGASAYRATTDREGQFAIADVAEGSYTVVVSAEGFT